MHQPDRATPLLAIVRIVCVLGLSFFIAGGIFLLLWGKVLLCVLALLLSIPFFVVMRFMEKHTTSNDSETGPAEF